MFELAAVPQSSTLQVHIGLRIALYSSNLLSIDSCDLLLGSQYILLGRIPSCFREYVLSPV